MGLYYGELVSSRQSQFYGNGSFKSSFDVLLKNMSGMRNHRLVLWSLLSFEVWYLIFLPHKSVEELTESYTESYIKLQDE